MRKNMDVHFNEIFVIAFYQVGVFLLEGDEEFRGDGWWCFSNTHIFNAFFWPNSFVFVLLDIKLPELFLIEHDFGT